MGSILQKICSNIEVSHGDGSMREGQTTGTGTLPPDKWESVAMDEEEGFHLGSQLGRCHWGAEPEMLIFTGCYGLSDGTRRAMMVPQTACKRGFPHLVPHNRVRCSTKSNPCSVAKGGIITMRERERVKMKQASNSAGAKFTKFLKGGGRRKLSNRLKLQGRPNLVQAVSHGAVRQTTVAGF